MKDNYCYDQQVGAKLLNSYYELLVTASMEAPSDDWVWRDC